MSMGRIKTSGLHSRAEKLSKVIRNDDDSAVKTNVSIIQLVRAHSTLIVFRMSDQPNDRRGRDFKFDKQKRSIFDKSCHIF